MKARMLAVALVLAALPALAHGQHSCAGCTAKGPSVIRPASAELWADYQQAPDCGGCGSCRRCCDPCCTPLLCIVPNTLRRIGRTLDCLLPCGPRSGHGCGLSCIGAGSGCMPGVCGRPGIFHPNKCCDFGCGEIAPPMSRGPLDAGPPVPPEPMHETSNRAQSSPYAKSRMKKMTAGAVALKSPAAEGNFRPAADARPIGSGVENAGHVAPVVNKKPASVLKRISFEEEVEATPARSTNWPRNMDSIPHNPLR